MRGHTVCVCVSRYLLQHQKEIDVRGRGASTAEAAEAEDEAAEDEKPARGARRGSPLASAAPPCPPTPLPPLCPNQPPPPLPRRGCDARRRGDGLRRHPRRRRRGACPERQQDHQPQRPRGRRVSRASGRCCGSCRLSAEEARAGVRRERGARYTSREVPREESRKRFERDINGSTRV